MKKFNGRRVGVTLLLAGAMAGTSLDARAGDFSDCGTPGSPYTTGSCWVGYTTTTYPVFQALSAGAGGITISDSAGGTGVASASSTGTGVAAASATGIGLSAITESGVFGGEQTHAAILAAYGSGVYDDSNDMAVFGSSSGGDGGHFLTNVAGNKGVYGINLDTGSNVNDGGVYGESAGSAGFGVGGKNSSSGYGGHFTSSSGQAVYGSTGNADGGHFENNGASVAAVSGTNSGDGYGIYGHGEGSTGVYGEGGAVGIYGQCTSSNCYAGYFYGSAEVTGGFYAAGSCRFGTCPSDERLKKNITPLKGALDTLMGLRGVTFEWKDPEAQPEGDRGVQIGFIAQNVEKTFPKWVGEHNGFKTLDIPQRQIAALQVEAIRTLKTENDGLRADVETLKEQVRTLAEGGHPIVGRSRFNFDGFGWGIAGVLGTSLFFVSRRKRQAA
jgi:hypothetical protein